MRLFILSAVLAAAIGSTFEHVGRAMEATEAGARPSGSPLWPHPKEYSLGSGSLLIDDDVFVFQQLQEAKSSVLERAMSRYGSLISGGKSVAATKGAKTKNAGVEQLNSCGIAVANVLSPEEEIASLDMNVDESYTLTISANKECLIQSQTVWGALHALETFTQLLKRQDGAVFCDYVPVSVNDRPRYTHRGVLVDTSRHYLPLDTLKKAVDSLTLSHFNVLHWHIVDAQAFPFNAPSAPEIVKGAYDPSLTYTAEQVKELTEYAADRGVRILPEVDVPGHTASWGAGYPNVIPKGCAQKYSANVNNQALNPTKDETFALVNSILTDIKQATSTKFMHLGGDEVVYGCWDVDPSIAEYMSANGIASNTDLFSQFILKVDDMAAKLGVTPIHWEDVFILGVKTAPNTIFNVWTNSVQIANVTSAGFQVIAAPSNYWYLDHPTNDWKVMYNYDPTTNITEQQASLIVGGETCMWGEYVDSDNWFQKVWPTAAAVGERLWSPKETRDLTDALSRLLVFRCRMEARGFKSTPVQPGFCGTTYV